MKGGFYHLYANIWKHMQSLGLHVRYNKELEFPLHLRTLSIFVPPQNVEELFDPLTDLIKNVYSEEVNDFLKCSEDTCIG